MKKNVASQKIGGQLVSATDGSAFTSAVTVYVTLDAGTQAIGSVGSGACTHEGNGFHTYAPAQAETNGDHIAFTFIGTGAVPATVQVFPSFPQTGDVYPVTVTEVADIKAVTDKLNTALELDGAVYRYTTNALEQAPAGGGGGDPWLTAVPGAYASGTAGNVLGNMATSTADAILGDNELATVDEIAAQVLVAANADPIAANTKEVNDISIEGTGVSPSDPWGP